MYKKEDLLFAYLTIHKTLTAMTKGRNYFGINVLFVKVEILIDFCLQFSFFLALSKQIGTHRGLRP